MRRRSLLSSAAAGSLVGLAGLTPLAATGAEPAMADAAPQGWREFEVTTRVTLLDSPGPAQVFVPLAQTAGGYQSSRDLRWQATGQADLVRDETYGAGLFRGTWNADTASQQVEVIQTIATRDRGALQLVPLTDSERRFWTAPTASAPTDGIVRETAERIIAGKITQRERLRALYDWVVDTTWRNPDTPGCGTGDYKAMLQTGQFGGKCADINGLMVGLARAAGLPARDVYGIRVADSRLFAPLGKSGDISKAQHCRAEVFLDDEGWFPVDPADVRKVVLEQKRAIDSPEVQALRERLFGHWEMNWIGYNSATDITLPGAEHQKPNFAFLMYPCAFTASGQPDCLDPARFRYQITSRDVTA